MHRPVADGAALLEPHQHLPGDRLALAVQIGRKDQDLGPGERRAHAPQYPRRPAPRRRVGHREAVVGADRARLRRQVAHVAVAGEHAVAAPEIPPHRLRLGRRFDDHDPHRRTTPGAPPTVTGALRAPARTVPGRPRNTARHTLCERRPRPPPRRRTHRPGPRPRGVGSGVFLASRSCLPAARAASAARRTAFTNRTNRKKKMPIASICMPPTACGGATPVSTRPLRGPRRVRDTTAPRTSRPLGRQTPKAGLTAGAGPPCLVTSLMRPAAPTHGNGAMFDHRRDLIRFLAVAEADGIARAAERIGITQPALTRIIARIERRFGAQLFERTPAARASPRSASPPPRTRGASSTSSRRPTRPSTPPTRAAAVPSA